MQLKMVWGRVQVLDGQADVATTVDDITVLLHYLKDPKLWESWYIPCYG